MGISLTYGSQDPVSLYIIYNIYSIYVYMYSVILYCITVYDQYMRTESGAKTEKKANKTGYSQVGYPISALTGA